MQSTQVPSKFPVPFANSGSRNTIPTFSQVSVTPGAASLTDGFPPLTMTPPAGGGVAPFGQDFNGILYQTTQNLQWLQAGGPIKYDAAFAAAIGGYPRGATLSHASVVGAIWVCTVDNNSTNPDAGGSGWAGGSLTGLGFTPVQQGTGVGQTGNTVKVGWSVAGKLKATVDTTDLGNIALESWSAGLFMGKGVTTGGRVSQVCNLTPGQSANNSLAFFAATPGWLLVVASINVAGSGIQPLPIPAPLQVSVFVDGVNMLGDSTVTSMSHSTTVPLASGSHSIQQAMAVANVAFTGGRTVLEPTAMHLSYLFVGA